MGAPIVFEVFFKLLGHPRIIISLAGRQREVSLERTLLVSRLRLGFGRMEEHVQALPDN